jgi:hypothetical protein
MRARRWAWTACAVAALASALAQAPLAADGADGRPTPPTAVRYADPGWYDLVDVRWVVDADGRPAALELELAAIDPLRPLLQPVLEAYLIVEEGGRAELLPGSGVVLAEGQHWSVAVRVTGQGAWAWRADGDAPGRALEVELLGRVVRVAWPADLPSEGRWAGLSGVYDPFHATAWRPFAREPSPWAFATPEPGPPVVDVFPDDGASLAQVQAGAPWSPRRPTPVRAPGSPWWWWMAGGLVLAVAGLVWRRLQPPAPVPAAPPEPSGEIALIGDVEVADDEAANVPDHETPDVAREDAGGTPDGDAPRGATAGPSDGPLDGRSARASRYVAEDRPATGTATGASEADPASATPSSRTT